MPRAPREELEPALQFLKTTSARQSRRFPRGTVQRDGRLDFCKQGLGAEGVDALLGHLVEGHAWLSHVLLGTNGLGDEGADVARLQLGDSPSALALGERHNSLEGAELHRLVRPVVRPVSRELGLRGAGVTSRDARRLLDALATVSEPPRVLLGAGIARRLRASAKKLSTRTCPAPTDVLRIASVYR